MELVNNTCQYCPKDYYSVGEKCEKCGPSTVPDKAYVFENWNVVPKELHETCISFASSKYNHSVHTGQFVIILLMNELHIVFAFKVVSLLKKRVH